MNAELEATYQKVAEELVDQNPPVWIVYMVGRASGQIYTLGVFETQVQAQEAIRRCRETSPDDEWPMDYVTRECAPIPF